MNLQQAINIQAAGQVSASKAGYKSPDNGPFKCSNCSHFKGNNKPCEKVKDPVMSNGYCKLFEKK